MPYNYDNSDCPTDSLRDLTASITSSILEYRHINGRPFQQSKTTEYWYHYTLLLFDDKLHLAPIGKNPQEILDIGTGTGIWAIAIDDWKKLYSQAFTHVRPGGWVESLEIDIETHSENPKVEKEESHIFKKWCKLFFECGRKTGLTWEIARDGRQEEYMREAGFTDLFSKSWKLPVGGWPQDKKLKQIGLYNEAFIDHSIDAFAIFPIGEILGWSKEEVTVLVSQMRKALKEPRALPYFNV
ncbi:s-adenosyl-l-methionine-dependent methyltransferase [Fusarium agapanthi]|uniref:S-adenosyl-l-methionine-dependent methyltransferase n=1 Tax=Fusarium agapanthi TaxID=1803897 RepID=A0A9P5E2X8_9HYPO|nr:s-adenosyl-l-methionine-dependent methyltransferase [Fusarium agapanthi]